MLSQVTPENILVIFFSSLSILCGCLMILRYFFPHSSTSSKQRSSGPIANMVCMMAVCDLIVALKFLLAALFPKASGDYPAVCVAQTVVGQGVALLSCCYNFLIW